MPVQPQQLDPLPLPQLDQNSAQNPVVPPAAKPMEGMGYVKPAGAGAYVASQILTGWMAGRQEAQKRKLDQAKTSVVGAKTAYDITAQNYQNLVDQGLDPNDPESKQKLDSAKMAVSHAWTNYLDNAQKYSTPDEGGKPKKKGAKQTAHDMFMGHDPQMFLDSSLNVLRQSGAPALNYGTSAEQKNQLALQKQQLEQNKNTLEQQSHDKAKQADVDALQKTYTDPKSTPEQKQQAKENLAVYGVNIAHVESAAEAKVADEIAQVKLSGIETLNTPGKTTSDLTVGQRAALGIQLGPLDAYMNEVGPGKKFKTAIDANRGYLRDQASASAIAGNSAQDRQWAQMRKAEATVLQHDLQDPATARKYGLPGPLQPGQKVPDWLIEKSVMGRLRPSLEEKAEAKVNVDKSISSAINNTLQYGMDAKTAQWAKQNLFDYDEQTKTYSLKPNLPDKESHWFKGDTQGGVSQEDFKKKREGALRMLAGYIKKTNPDASAERIMGALNSDDAAAYFLDNQDSGKASTPGADRSIPEPPKNPQNMNQLGEEPVKSKYQIQTTGTDGKAQVQEMELTSDEADYIQQTHKDVTVRFVPSARVPHGR